MDKRILKNRKGMDAVVTANEISTIKNEKMMFEIFKVKKVGAGVFKIIGYNYGEEQENLTGHADEVAKWLNGYFGLSE